MQFQLEAISLPGVLQANYTPSGGDLQRCWVFIIGVFSLICLRQKSYQLHTSFVATYATPLGITAATQDLEPTSQAAILPSLSTMKSEFLCLRKNCGTSVKNYRNPEGCSQTKQLLTLFCSELQTSPSRHFFNINSTLPRYSLWILVVLFHWKLLLLKREYQISSNPHKKDQGTSRLWSGQS